MHARLEEIEGTTWQREYATLYFRFSGDKAFLSELGFMFLGDCQQILEAHSHSGLGLYVIDRALQTGQMLLNLNYLHRLQKAIYCRKRVTDLENFWFAMKICSADLKKVTSLWVNKWPGNFDLESIHDTSSKSM